jgi:SAM-dependent methyltransferase
LRTVTLSTSEGPYGELYQSREFLWPNRPGRMVRRAVAEVVPARSLDLGCGDGKNAYYLESLGSAVDALDISGTAVTAASKRLSRLPNPTRGTLWCDDVSKCQFESDAYELVVCYGLYHCLDDNKMEAVHSRVERALKHGGLLAFAAFNDLLPLPDFHRTPGVVLRARDHIFEFTKRWETISAEFGEIQEDHLPLVQLHKHAMTWALLRKP